MEDHSGPPVRPWFVRVLLQREAEPDIPFGSGVFQAPGDRDHLIRLPPRGMHHRQWCSPARWRRPNPLFPLRHPVCYGRQCGPTPDPPLIGWHGWVGGLSTLGFTQSGATVPPPVGRWSVSYTDRDFGGQACPLSINRGSGLTPPPYATLRPLT
jgi:hypothetical protein